LETGALPIELLAYPTNVRHEPFVPNARHEPSLFLLLVRRVLATERTELLHLDPFGRLFLVLRRAVIAALALAAGHLDDVSHCRISVSYKFQVQNVVRTVGVLGQPVRFTQGAEV
jgi:hypothetical protein